MHQLKSQIICFIETNGYPKIHKESQGILNSQNKIEKEQIKDLMLSNFKTYYKAMVMKTVWFWHKHRYID